MKIKYEYKTTLNNCAERFVRMQDFNVTDIKVSLILLKNDKAADMDVFRVHKILKTKK